MANKKDLIDAQAFSRRRLLTAFTSGAPGGKELEPAKPLRAVVAGVAMSVMIVIGGLFYGMINTGLGEGWENNTVILVKSTGERYITIEGVLHPVLNTTSARLIAPAGQLKIKTVSAAALDGIPVGPAVGIVGAPDDVPSKQDLVSDAWTACPAGEGTAVDLPGVATGANPSDAVLVVSDGIDYVIVGSYRYPLGESRDQVLRQLGLASAVPTPVDSRWLNLFAAGAPLEPLQIAGEGEQLAGLDLVVGTAVRTTGSTNIFVVTSDAELAPLSPFAYQLYLLGTGGKLGDVRDVALSEVSDLDNDEPAGDPSWPQDVLTPLPVGSAICALLGHDQVDGSATTTLALAPVAPQEPGFTIAPGHGALVFATGQGKANAGVAQLIDASGTAYPLADASDDLLARLGYTAEDVTGVPLAWTQFFAAGPELSIAAAGSTPAQAQPGQAIVQTSARPTTQATAQAGGTTQAPSPSAMPEQTATPGASASPTTSASADGSLAVSASAATQCEAGTVTLINQTPPALDALQATTLWERWRGDGVVVAVVDSGIDAANPHFADGAIAGGINLVPDGERADGLSDPFGHGTAVAGVIAARPVDGSGVVGVAPGATLLSVRVYRGTDEDSLAAGYGPSMERLAQGIRWAVDNGATVINVSLSTESDDAALREAVTYATDAGALVVASAGNRATTANKEDSPRYPGAYANALAVAATNASGAVDDASIHGEHVDIAAPGQDVVTTMSLGGDCVFATDAASPSYATAYAAGAAALIAQAHADEGPADWAYRMEATALRMQPDARDDLAGWGSIQPLDAIAIAPGTETRGPAHPDGTSALAVAPPAVQVVGETRPQPYAKALQVLGISTAAAAMALAGIAMLRARRARPLAQPAAQEHDGQASAPDTGRTGLLDARKDLAQLRR